MNLTDEYCLQLFPELLKKFDYKELRKASETGSYIFHEDYLLKLIIESNSENLYERFANYIEYLISDKNTNLNNLGIIGLLEGAINQELTQIIPYLGKTTKNL